MVVVVVVVVVVGEVDVVVVWVDAVPDVAATTAEETEDRKPVGPTAVTV